MFKPVSASHQAFYNSKLFVGLKNRMIDLCCEPTQKLKQYTVHLERMGVNLHSYLSPSADDVFSAAIKGEDPSASRNNEQLDEIILRLVEAQDREWDRNLCVANTVTKLNNIVPAAWNYNFKTGHARIQCQDEQSGREMIATLKSHNVTAVLQRHTETKAYYVYVKAAYAQIKYGLDANPATEVQAEPNGP